MAALIDLVVYFILFNFLKVSAVPSTIVSISCATIMSFTLNAIVNFQIKDKFFIRFISYVLVSGVGMIISASMLYFLHNIKNFDGNIVKII